MQSRSQLVTEGNIFVVRRCGGGGVRRGGGGRNDSPREGSRGLGRYLHCVGNTQDLNKESYQYVLH